METVLGLIGLVIFIVCIIALAAGVTWVVVRLSPNKKKDQAPKSKPPAPAAE